MIHLKKVVAVVIITLIIIIGAIIGSMILGKNILTDPTKSSETLVDFAVYEIAELLYPTE